MNYANLCALTMVAGATLLPKDGEVIDKFILGNLKTVNGNFLLDYGFMHVISKYVRPIMLSMNQCDSDVIYSYNLFI